MGAGLATSAARRSRSSSSWRSLTRSESVEWTTLPTPYSPVQHSSQLQRSKAAQEERREVTYSAAAMEGIRATRASTSKLPFDILCSASEFWMGRVVDRHVALVAVSMKLVTQGERDKGEEELLFRRGRSCILGFSRSGCEGPQGIPRVDVRLRRCFRLLRAL